MSAVLTDIGVYLRLASPLPGGLAEQGESTDLPPRFPAERRTPRGQLGAKMPDLRCLLPNHLFGSVAQHLLGPPVEEGDEAILVRGDNGRLRRGIEHGLKSPAFRLHLFGSSVE